MAKKSKTYRPPGRDGSTIASRRLPLWTSTPVNLSLFQDLRSFHPAGPSRPLFTFRPNAARVVAKAPAPSRSGRMRFSHPGLSFAAPDSVLVCVRRSRRKEVLFAKNKAGKRGQKRPRRNYWSSISC